MKKINTSLYLGLLMWVNTLTVCAAKSTSQSTLTDVVQNIIPNASPNAGPVSYGSIAQTMQYWIFALVGVIAVIYILWVGAKLLWAPGNVEEVSTAMKSLGYIVLGLALIPFAWFIISFIIHFSL